MGKNLNMNSMDKLFSGLTRTEVKQEDDSLQEATLQPDTPISTVTNTAASKKSPKGMVEKTHICITLNTETLGKIKAISAKEGIYVRDIFNFALVNVIDRYEELYGKISVKKRKKGDIGEVLKM